MRKYSAIFLVSAAILIYEICVTRILSVVVWYHWAFLAVSLAMLGIGLPGVWYSMRRQRADSLKTTLLLASAVTPLSTIFLLKLSKSFGSYTVLACMAAILVPMLCLGSSICLLLLQAPGKRISRMYGFDLLGACLGGLIVIPLMHVVPTPHILAAAGALPLGALFLLGRPFPPLAFLLLAAIPGTLFSTELLQLRFTKLYDETQMRLIFEKWTPTARLAVFDGFFQDSRNAVAFGWGMGSKYEPRPIPQYWLEQDGSAGTPITRFSGSARELDFLAFDVTTVGYQLGHPGRVAIVGAGGGRDILSALKFGAGEVDAVEFNHHIVDALSGPFRDFSGDVYHLPGTRAVISEGRSFLTRTRSLYDLIQISLIDSFSATAAGAFALTENNLYTVEAYRLYWNKLSPSGLVSTTRWIGGVGRLQTPRLVILTKEALRQEGVDRPERHIAVIRAADVATVLLSKRPFSSATLGRLNEVCESRGFAQLFPRVAGRREDGFIEKFLTQGPGLAASVGIDLSPSTDDRPFFFQVRPVFGLGSTESAAGRRSLDPALRKFLDIPDDPVRALRILVIVLSVLTVGLYFAPFLVSRPSERRADRGFWQGSAYFAFIGIGFMLVEIPLMQRFFLYLGHPTVATSAVLTAILLGAGLGAMSASRVGVATARRVGFAVAVLLCAMNAFLSLFFQASLGWPFFLRIGLAYLLVVPLGYLMGFAFPMGMLHFGDDHKAWFWAMNGAASVLASALSLALSMTVGFAPVIFLGAACYLGAWGLLRSSQPELSGEVYRSSVLGPSANAAVN
ncbi:MAG: hypothetical protein ACE5JX_21970 [Acidobacteriota bacterium]